MIDFDRGSEVSGSKFYYLRGVGALLEIALVNYAIHKCVTKGYTPYITPDLGEQREAARSRRRDHVQGVTVAALC